MKILQLSNKIPYPLKDGGAIATFAMTKGFAAHGHEITLLAMNTSKHYQSLKDVEQHVSAFAKLITVDVNTDIRIADALSSLLKNKSYNIQRFVSNEYQSKLVDLLNQNEYDVIQLEGLYLSPYVKTIRANSKALISMRAHNIEFEIWERIANQTKSITKRNYLKKLAKQLKKHEIAHLNSYDVIVPITERDAVHYKDLGCNLPIHVANAGIDHKSKASTPPEMEWPSIFFLGALDWIPNQEGFYWFLDSVWPILHKKFPKLPFYVAGRNAPDEILKINLSNVTILGEIPDAGEFMLSKGILIVPLLSGSGMRVKIIEGMSYGKAMVSTSIGAEGISVTNKKNILIADSVEEWVQAISDCLENKQYFSNIGEKAKEFVTKNFDNSKITSSLLNFYTKHAGS